MKHFVRKALKNAELHFCKRGTKNSARLHSLSTFQRLITNDFWVDFKKFLAQFSRNSLFYRIFVVKKYAEFALTSLLGKTSFLVIITLPF